MAAEESLDEIDQAIIGELQQDGRRAFREIARKLSVSERTVRSRVRRMRENGALRILAFVDPAQLGHYTLAMILLRVQSDAEEGIVQTVASWPEVSYVSSLLARSDIYLQVICRDNDELWRLVTRRLGAIEGVLEVETMLEIKVHKFAYMNSALLHRRAPDA